MAIPRSRPSAPDGPQLLDLLRDTLIYSGCELLRLESTHPGGFRRRPQTQSPRVTASRRVIVSIGTVVR